jgi:hypothetical protein
VTQYFSHAGSKIRAIAAFAWWAVSHSLFSGERNTRNVDCKDEGSFGSTSDFWMAMKQSWGVWREKSVALYRQWIRHHQCFPASSWGVQGRRSPTCTAGAAGAGRDEREIVSQILVL